MKFLVFLGGISLGFMMGGHFSAYEGLTKNFFDFNITDLAQVITPIIVGWFIYEFVSRKISNSDQTRSLFYKILDDYKDVVEEIYSIAQEHFNSPTQEKSDNLIRLSKKSLNILGFFNNCIEQTHKDMKINSGILKHSFFDLKSAVTSRSIIEIEKVSLDQRNGMLLRVIEIRYCSALNDIYKVKLQILSCI